jgi:toxin ParE1/3/4
MLDLIWEPEAERQYALVVEFIGSRNPAAAVRLARLIDEAVERVRHFPSAGRPGRVDGTRELIVHPNYVIVYQVTSSAVDVLRLLHARQRYP